MGNDLDLASALREHSVHLDRANKLTYLKMQHDANAGTPTSVVFGSYFFNPQSNSQGAEWRQLLQRNDRRQSVTLFGITEQQYIATSDTTVDIETLINLLGKGLSGIATAMGTIQVGGGLGITNPITIPTTEAIWAASIGDAGVEEATNLTWFETIYSSPRANPNGVEASRHKEGDTQEIGPELEAWLGTAKAGFGRGGVR